MHRTGGTHGFTLLETLIFSAIFGIVLLGIYTVYGTSHTTFTRGQNKIEVQQNARVAMEMMARDIRMAGFDPSDVINDVPTTAIQVTNANDITFVGDVDGDGNTDQVRYSLNGNEQIIWESASWNGAAFPPATPSVLADGVSALTFTYFDGSDAVTAILADVRRITVDITTQETGGGRQENFPLTMDVRLRNLQ